jgi:hypothetical protein
MEDNNIATAAACILAEFTVVKYRLAQDNGEQFVRPNSSAIDET